MLAVVLRPPAATVKPFRETSPFFSRVFRPSFSSIARLGHEVHDGGVERDAVPLQAPVKLLRDAGRQLRPGFFFGLCHQTFLFFGGRPGPRRRLRRRRPFFAGFLGETVLSNDWIAERTSC